MGGLAGGACAPPPRPGLHADLGRLLVRLRDGRRTELVVSRNRVRPLRERLGLS